MDLAEESLRTYMEALLPYRDDLLMRLEEEAKKEGIPIVGPHVGSLLAILVRLLRARSAA